MRCADTLECSLLQLKNALARTRGHSRARECGTGRRARELSEESGRSSRGSAPEQRVKNATAKVCPNVERTYTSRSVSVMDSPAHPSAWCVGATAAGRCRRFRESQRQPPCPREVIVGERKEVGRRANFGAPQTWHPRWELVDVAEGAIRISCGILNGNDATLLG